MNRVVRVNATDGNIMYSGQWTKGYGTSIKLYGRRGSQASGRIFFYFDNNKTIMDINGTATGDEVSLVYHADSVEDGDHEFSGALFISSAHMEINYFMIENPSGDPFDLLSAGPAAQNVPSQAVTVDNSSPDIIYYNHSQWIHSINTLADYGSSASFTTFTGGSLSYSFDGAAIWYYGEVGPDFGFFKVSIDGSTPHRLTASRDLSLSQRLIWSNTSLGPGRHNLTLTNDDDTGKLSLDFFRVLPEDSTSTPLSTTSHKELPTNEPPTNENPTNRVPLAVGLALGLLALVVLVLSGVYYRRRKAMIDHDVHSASPYTMPPMRQAGQPSSLPPDGKRPPQPGQPSNAPMATGNPAMSSTGSGLGPPPRYESLMYDWRVETAQ